MKKVAILQSNYIPWKGYFDIIASVDEFILYDDMQYTRRDWRNRNKIITPNGEQWLTIPVQVKGKFYQKINETKIDGNRWAIKHWNTIKHNYSKAEYFDEISELLEPLYIRTEHIFLSNLNQAFIQRICDYLNIETIISQSTKYSLIEGQNERLIDLCVQAGADQYFSGPAAKSYIDTSLFQKENIEVIWVNYEDYPVYHQLCNDFTHYVSIIDLLMNCGQSSKNHMKFSQHL